MTQWSMPQYDERAPLPNLQPLTQRQFARSKFSLYAPVRMFTGRVQLPDTASNRNLVCLRTGGAAYALAPAFVMHDGTGYAVLCDHHTGRVRYYSFGQCAHPRRTRRTVGNCLNEYRCEDCGYTETIDSSD